MNSPNHYHAIAAARKLIFASRITVGLLAVSNVLANGILQFTDDDSSGGPRVPMEVDVSRFLNSVLIPLALFTAILILTVFASVYVERLASDVTRLDAARPVQATPEGNIAVNDEVWRR